MPQCCVVLNPFSEGAETQCPNTAIAQCADLNCGDPVCANHGEQCEGCEESYCMPHAMSHKCGDEKKGPQPSKHFIPRKVTA